MNSNRESIIELVDEFFALYENTIHMTALDDREKQFVREKLVDSSFSELIINYVDPSRGTVSEITAAVNLHTYKEALRIKNEKVLLNEMIRSCAVIETEKPELNEYIFNMLSSIVGVISGMIKCSDGYNEKTIALLWRGFEWMLNTIDNDMKARKYKGALKKVGETIGGIVGGIAGGVTMGVGELIDNNFVKEIGETVADVSLNAGKTIGQTADGIVGVGAGILTSNSKLVSQSYSDLEEATIKTVTGVCKGVEYIAESGIEVVEGISNGDDDKLVSGTKRLVKVAAVSALAVGVGDYLDIINDDFGDVDSHIALDIDTDDIQDIEINGDDVTNMHDVDPHYVSGHVQNNKFVEGYWRDGDGDTSIDLNKNQGGGYLRSNPDGLRANNLKK